MEKSYNNKDVYDDEWVDLNDDILNTSIMMDSMNLNEAIRWIAEP